MFKGASGTVVLDAFLTGYERYGCIYPPPFKPEDADCFDLVLGTHLHPDHIDPVGFPGMLHASPKATGIVPAPLLDQVIGLHAPPDRLRGALVDIPLTLGAIKITSLPAVHADACADGYRFWTDDEGRHKFLGYALDMDGVHICHVGDTLAYVGLGELLRELDLDLLLLPINGVSWFREQRGFVGNMNVFEAAELAEMSGARLTVPIHWDLFADNSEDPEHFVTYAAKRHPGAVTRVVERWKRFDIQPRQPDFSPL